MLQWAIHRSCSASSSVQSSDVIGANGEGVIFSGGSSTTSDDNEVRNNVISNSKIRWLVESYWSGPVGRGNTVHHNCLWPTNPKISYNQNGGVQPNAPGFVSYRNVRENPLHDSSSVGATSDCRSVYG
jgi:hypothetical protein